MPAICHHALTCRSPLTASRSWSRRRLPRVGARMWMSARESAGVTRVWSLVRLGAGALGRARLVPEHELALDRPRLGTARRAPAPDAVRAEVPGVGVVGQRALERVE